VQFAKLEAGHTDEVSFNHLQHLNQYTDLLVRATHVLQLNITVLTTLSREATKRQDMDSAASAPRYEIFAKIIQNCLDDHAFIKGHVGLVRERAERIAVMVNIPKTFRLVYTLKANSWLIATGYYRTS
jgi:hypothetical protein